MWGKQIGSHCKQWQHLYTIEQIHLKQLGREWIMGGCMFRQGGVGENHLMTSQSRKVWRASLVAQWLRICLPMQGTRVRALVWEDPTCRGATGPVSHSCWACASGACAPQQERPRQREARAPRWRVAPARRNWRKPSHRNEDPTQQK